MQYKINGTIIDSHHAAKSHLEKARSVSEYLRQHPKVGRILDFGCGKLRYSDDLASICERITFVDSEIQISRKQQVRSELTTIKDYVRKHYPKSEVVAFENRHTISVRYPLIFCSNVLSAIPCKETFDCIIAFFHEMLLGDGKIVIINQHRNEHFKRYESGTRHMFGYLHKGKVKTSYYGLLRKEQIRKILERHGFKVDRLWNEGERNFVEARKPPIET